MIVSLPASALTDEEIFRDFRFNLINPGARARGIAGAFVSLSDDATAAQSNPAGLSFLRRSEFFAELRFVDNGAQSSVNTNTLPTGTETFVATGTSFNDTTNLSFLSGVLARDRWSIGFSRQALLNINNSTLSSFAFRFADSPGSFLVAGDGAIDAQAVNWNVSAGFRITDQFSLGATVAYSTLEVDALVTNTIIDTEGTLTDQQPILEPVMDLQTTINDKDDDFIYSIGLLYRQLDKWSVGAMYRRGPRFTLQQQITTDGDGNPAGLDVFDVYERLGSSFEDQFNLPDTLAIGGSWNVSGRLTVAVDIDRILYSNLVDGYVSGVNVLTGPDAEFTIDDATDYRGGVEYVFSNQRSKVPPLALRGGVYTEESSTIRATSTGSGSFADESAFREGGRQEHLTLGLGVILKRYQFDMAFDFAERTNEFLLSFIYKGK